MSYVMSIKSFEKFEFCIGLGFILLGDSSFEPKMSATNDRPFAVQSSTETFQAKNVTIEGSISLSSGSDFVKGKKIRFANK